MHNTWAKNKKWSTGELRQLRHGSLLLTEQIQLCQHLTFLSITSKPWVVYEIKTYKHCHSRASFRGQLWNQAWNLSNLIFIASCIQQKYVNCIICWLWTDTNNIYIFQSISIYCHIIESGGRIIKSYQFWDHIAKSWWHCWGNTKSWGCWFGWRR